MKLRLRSIFGPTIFALVGLLILAACPTSSDWDNLWGQMQAAMNQGNIHEAKHLLHDMLPFVEERGPTDERYAEVIFHLGQLSRLEGEDTQAEAYYWQSLPLIAQSLGPEHLHMSDPLAEIATIYHRKGQSQKALPLLKRALTIREKSWGRSNPQLLPTLKMYHTLLLATGQDTNADPIQAHISLLQGKSS